MSQGYDEVEVMILVPGRDPEPYYFNKCNINYYRPYRDNSPERKSTLKTMVFLAGNDNGLVINSSCDAFRNQLKDEKVSLSGLTEEQKSLVKKIVESYHKERNESFKEKERELTN